MSDILNDAGLQTKDLTTLISELETELRSIYGTDINLDPNSPDGQIVNIVSQLGVDLRELLTSVNSGFDPDQAEGTVLDQRVAINGISRAGGTFTTVLIDVTTDRAVNLVGLDTASAEIDPDVENLYTIKDNEGTLFYLLNSQSIGAAGTNQYTFRAADLGTVEITIGTITTPVTVIAGVTAVNNPGGALVQGQDEETDSALRLRRKRSTGITSTGYLDALQSALQSLDGVTTAIVEENNTSITDSDGTPGHTIWCIVEGGDNDDIGDVIYRKRSAGCGMRGAVSVDVPRITGGTFEVLFDRPVNQDLYIQFTLTYPDGVFDEANIKALIVENVIWGVGETALSDVIISYVKSLNEDYQITNCEISDDDSTYVEVLPSASPQDRWINNVARITINT